MKKMYTLLLMFVSMSFAFSQVEGTWKISPVEGALSVGPSLDDLTWWASSGDDVTTRDCFFDDRYVFNADGSFSNVLGDNTWVEAWQGVAEDGCAAPVAPHDNSNAATWSFNADLNQVTLDGTGAFLGIPKAVNGAELTNPADAPSSVTYAVAIDGDNMVVDINMGAGWWRFLMEKTDPVSTFETVENQFSFFPNPATSDIQINFVDQMDEMSIRDITGRALIVRANPALTETVDVSTLPSGLYLLQSRSGNQISVQKLVIE